MAKKEINLKGLSHVSSNDKKTVLKHKNGAFVTIHHPSLSPESQAQLAALKGVDASQAAQPIDAKMAEGGVVYDGKTMNAVKKEKYDDRPQSAYAEGGKVVDDTGYPHDVPVDQQKERLPKKPAADFSKGASSPGTLFSPVPSATPKPYAEGGDVSTSATTQSTERSETPQTGKCVVIRPDKGYGAIIRCGAAEGGEIKLHNDAMPKFCMNCGGKVHMMADGGDINKVESQDELISDENPKPTTDFKPEIADEIARLPMTIGEDVTKNVLDTPAAEQDFTPEKQPLSEQEKEYNARANMRSMNRPDYMEAIDTRGHDPITEHGVLPQKPDMGAMHSVVNSSQWDKANQEVAAQKDMALEAEKRKLGAQMGLQDPNAQPTAPASVPQQPQTPMVPQVDSGLPNPMDAEGRLMQGVNQQMQGIQQGAQAAGALGQVQAQQMLGSNEAIQHAKAEYDRHFQDLDAERQALQQDIREGQVDPNKFWTGDKNGNGGHSKIMAGIGMILAGFNPTTNPNAAINFLKHQMELNIQAQSRNLGSKESMLSANLRQFGNLRDAMDMTRIMQHDILANELGAAAATAQSPMAKAAALQAMGKLNMDTAPMIQQFAMRRAMMNMANSTGSNPQAIDHMLGYLRVTNPEMAKEMESRYIPGVGMASVPVPESVRKEVLAHDTLDTIGRDLLNYSKTHTNLIPGTAEYNVGAQKAQILQQNIREGLLGTVFRESEKPLLQQFVDSNPAGAFKMLSTQPKLRTLLESNMMQGNVMRKQYGLPAKTAPMDTTPKMGANGKMYVEKMIGGKKYMVPAQ